MNTKNLTFLRKFKNFLHAECVAHTNRCMVGITASCAKHSSLTHFCKFASLVNKNIPLPQGARGEGLVPYSREREHVSCAKRTVKHLFSYSPINLFTSTKAAFTLAEVLITLGIIGVVAALTMPILIQNFRRSIIEVKFKKQISVITQAFSMALAKDRAIPEINDDVDVFIDYVLPDLNVIKSCTNGETACGLLDVKCLHGRDKGLTMRNSDKRYILQDGTFIGFKKTGTGINDLKIYIDLNGNKPPNKLGYDTFILIVNKDENNNSLILRSFAQLARPDVTFEKDGQGCDKAHTKSGLYCGIRVIYDGYKITYW